MPWWFRRPSGSAHDPAVIAELHRRVDSVPPAQRLVDTMMGACSGLTPSGDNVLTRFHFASPSTRIRFEALAGETREASTRVHHPAPLRVSWRGAARDEPAAAVPVRARVSVTVLDRRGGVHGATPPKRPWRQE
jgi:hypothetical protein